MNDEDQKTIDQLREALARQILGIALLEDNAQYKLDAFRATERYGSSKRAADPVATPMTDFANRVKRAEKANGSGKPAERNTDTESE